MLKSLLLVSYSVTLFGIRGNEIIADVIVNISSFWSRVGSLPSMTGILLKGKIWVQTYAHSKNKSRRYQKLWYSPGINCLLSRPEGACQTSELPVRQYISAVWAIQLVLLCYSSPSKQTPILNFKFFIWDKLNCCPQIYKRNTIFLVFLISWLKWSPLLSTYLHQFFLIKSA